MKWFLLCLLCFTKICLAKNESQQAVTHIQKAALSYPLVKGYVRTAERNFYEYLPISREYAGAFGSVAMTAVSGNLNTRQLKNFDIDFYGGKCRPDIIYNFKNKEAVTLVLINWSW